MKGNRILEWVGKLDESVACLEHQRAANNYRYTHHVGRAFRNMLVGWESYANDYFEETGMLIGDDYIIGEAWKDIGVKLLELLNGEIGGFSPASIDHNIRSIMKENKVELDP